MSTLLGSVVRFRGDKLFNGAVSIDWFDADEKKAAAASAAFVFHGPTYHGVSQADIGSSHGHRLQDSASFVKAVVDHCYGLDDVPFTLAIAGYGTGKSHLALTIGRLLDNPTGSEADSILAGLAAADQNIAANLRTLLTDTKQPCLVLALNGMRSVDLASETTRQIIRQVQKRGLNTRPLDELRPRFKQAESLLRMAKDNLELINAVLSACDASTVDEIIAKLEQQDDAVYRQVNTVLEQHNIRISAYGGESVRDVIDLAAREYCGVGKAFKSILILFDEFGRYTEFATTRSHIAGSGALQDLFEAVQNNTGKVCFVGFIQFELNAYVQRVAVEHRNEIMRYVTRYQTANKAFLSINLETLIANLIEKRDVPFLDSMLNTDAAREESMQIMSSIGKWFPSSQHHHLWQDDSRFHNVVRKGCWPLSPYAVWLLFHLAAAGKHLQERSVLALLGETFDRFQNYPIDGSKSSVLWPVDLLTESLQHELISSEESGQQGAITHSYASAMARHGMQFMTDHIRILQAIVLAAKMGLRVSHKNDATAALAALAGLSVEIAAGNLQELSDEFNIVEWDEGFKQFDILGDAVPKAQFLAYIRQRVNSTYDVKGKANLFSSKAKEWCDDLGDRECDFGEENKISTT
ncbi:MAG: hypothetical protein GX945_12015 [Lentisphaerae bacterium]|nr:hypothetical protein [Lentisphaerota bacterium]